MTVRAARITMREMKTYTAVVKNDGAWWYGWIEEAPGVNAQEATRDELLVALEAAQDDYTEEPIAL